MPKPTPFNETRRDGTLRQYDANDGVYSHQSIRELDSASLSHEHREMLWGGGVFRHVWSNPLFLRAIRAETVWLSRVSGSRAFNIAAITIVLSTVAALGLGMLPRGALALVVPSILMTLILVAWLLAMFLRPAMLSTGIASLEELRLTPLSPVELVTGMLWGHAISQALPFLFLWPGVILWAMIKWPMQPFVWGGALLFGPCVVLSCFSGSAVALSNAIAEFCNPMQHVRSIATTAFIVLVFIAPLAVLSLMMEEAGLVLFSVGYLIISVALAAGAQQQAVIHIRFRFN